MVIACVNEVSKNCMKRLMHVVAVKCMNGTCNFSKIHTNVSFLNSSLCFFYQQNNHCRCHLRLIYNF